MYAHFTDSENKDDYLAIQFNSDGSCEVEAHDNDWDLGATVYINLDRRSLTHLRDEITKHLQTVYL